MKTAEPDLVPRRSTCSASHSIHNIVINTFMRSLKRAFTDFSTLISLLSFHCSWIEEKNRVPLWYPDVLCALAQSPHLHGVGRGTESYNQSAPAAVPCASPRGYSQVHHEGCSGPGRDRNSTSHPHVSVHQLRVAKAAVSGSAGQLQHALGAQWLAALKPAPVM